jgi:hypothetical protein
MAYYPPATSGGAPEGTAVLSTGEVGGTKFLREDGDGTSSWQTPTASATITTQDEGGTLSSSVTTLNFVGAGVVASGAGATTTVTIAGGGGSASNIYLVTMGGYI